MSRDLLIIYGLSLNNYRLFYQIYNDDRTFAEESTSTFVERL